MTRTPFGHPTAHRQTGAALIVGLLMLLVLTALAISGVNSSSLNLIMAGNAQYTQNAFQAAESGIERAIAANEFNPDPSLDPETQENQDVSDVASYTATSTPQLCGAPQPALPGSSLDSFSTYHFEIDSTGVSKRDATVRLVQALAVIAPAESAAAQVPGECGGGPGGFGTRLE
jgi:type IV pilus assembly protein PilX